MKQDENTSQQDLDKEREERLREIRELSAQADAEEADLQLTMFPEEDADIGFDIDELKNSQDPDRSWRIYYTIRRLLMDNLPKEKQLRKLVYNEKNLFLNRGREIVNGKRGSDGRMAFLDSHLTVALDIVTDWIKGGADPTEIFIAFYDRNKESGYR